MTWMYHWRVIVSSETINLGTRGPRTFVQGHIVSGRPSPQLREWSPWFILASQGDWMGDVGGGGGYGQTAHFSSNQRRIHTNIWLAGGTDQFLLHIFSSNSYSHQNHVSNRTSPRLMNSVHSLKYVYRIGTFLFRYIRPVQSTQYMIHNK